MKRFGSFIRSTNVLLPDASELLEAILSASPVGLAICDEQLRYRAVNQALAQMNGLPVEAHLGRTIREMLGAVATKIEPPLRRAFATGDPVALELAAQLPARSDVGYWTTNFVPIRGEQGRVNHVCAIVVEVTHAKELELSLLGIIRQLVHLKVNMVDLVAALDSNGKESYAWMTGIIDFCFKEMITISLLLSEQSSQRNPLALTGNSGIDLKNQSSPDVLSPRELEILRLLPDGKSNKEVANLLGITARTVETRRKNMMLKLGLHSISELVSYAFRNKIVDL
jgi:PAS domain S-box-containing protein